MIDSASKGIPRLHVITDDAIIARVSFVDTATTVLTSLGASGALHIRGHATSGRRLFETIAALKPVAARTGTMLVVNDRLDVALAAEVHAIQLGPRSFTVEETRRVLHNASVGLSLHSADERQPNVDWVIAGHIFDTPSHSGEPARGLVFLKTVVEHVTAPVIAVGGIRLKDVKSVRGTGAHGVAVIRGIWDAPGEAVAAVAQYLDALES